MSQAVGGHSEHTPLETVRLNNQDRQALMGKLNTAGGGNAKWQAERRALRVDFEATRILFMMTQKTGNEVRHAAVPRNLSKRGIAFVLGRFVYPESDCKVAIPALNGDWLAIPGVVRRCRHVTGIYHEVSVVFNEPIDLRDFIMLTREQEDVVRDELVEDFGEQMAEEDGFCEHVLIVNDDKANRKLLNHWLSQLGLRTQEVATAAQAVKQVKDHSIDLIIVDQNLTDAKGTELIQQLRSNGLTVPLVLSSIEDTQETRDQGEKAGASGFLAMPYTLDHVKTLVQEQLLRSVDADAEEPLYSSFRDDDSMHSLLMDFVRMLVGTTNKLNSANNSSDFEQVERVCNQLKGAGGSYGFEQISEMADVVLKQLAEEKREADAIHDCVADLVRTLRRVKV